METTQDNQSRDRQIESVLIPAFANASKLKLNKTEVKKLMRSFPDDAIEIRPGDGIIFIPHIHLSDRLNLVFNPGAWTLVCRRHWHDELSGNLRAEHILIIRGCAVGEAMGEFNFNPIEQKYGDALETTAAEALRRICGKRLSCGNQVWQSAFVAKWKKKNAETYRGQDSHLYWRKKGSVETLDAEIKRPPEGRGKRDADKLSALTGDAADNARHVMLQILCSECPKKEVEKFAVLKGFIKAGQALADWNPEAIAVEEWQIKKLTGEVKEFSAKNAAPPHWGEVVLPFGKNTGQKLKNLNRANLLDLHKEFTVEKIGENMVKNVYPHLRTALDAAAKELKLDEPEAPAKDEQKQESKPVSKKKK